MRKMLLGIYLAIMGIASLIGLGFTGFGVIAAVLLFGFSAHAVIDGYFSMGPKSREDGEEDNQPPLPPQYK